MAVPEMSIESKGVSTVSFSGALTRMMTERLRRLATRRFPLLTLTNIFD
jgi:hypothetical protein